MKNNRIIFFVFFILVLLLSSCENLYKEKDNNLHSIDNNRYNDSLIESNINMLKYESDLIDAYVNYKKMDVVKTGTGLRYQIIDEGDGDLLKTGDMVTIEYELRLLNDKLLYSSNNDGVKTFVVGRGGVESGLEEAILKLRMNSVAVLIIPSHLAHGIAGDGNRIPLRATIVYKLKVIENK